MIDENGRQVWRTANNYYEYNRAYSITSGEVYDLVEQPSLTDPSQAIALREIIERYSRGGAVRVLKPQFIDEEQEGLFQGIDFDKLDKVEQVAMLKRSAELVEAYRAKVDKVKDREAKKAQDDLKAELEALRKKLADSQSEDEVK